MRHLTLKILIQISIILNIYFYLLVLLFNLLKYKSLKEKK